MQYRMLFVATLILAGCRNSDEPATAPVACVPLIEPPLVET